LNIWNFGFELLFVFLDQYSNKKVVEKKDTLMILEFIK